MKVSLGEIASLVEGRLTGGEDTPIDGAATIWDAKPGKITFAENPHLARKAIQCGASAVLTSAECLDNLHLEAHPEEDHTGKVPQVIVDDVHASFAKIVTFFRPPYQPPRIGVSSAAHISQSAQLEEDVDVYAGAYIGDHVKIGKGAVIHPGVQIMADCQIGEKTILFPRVVLYERTVVGPRSILHAGVVIGAYGFGYQTVEGRHNRAAQLGHVEIGADVEIGANTTIDRGAYGATTIGEGTKIDNLVMIAHNCRLGRHNLICSQVGIAGSCTTGDYVVMAGQVGLRDHIEIGERAMLGAKAGVMHDIPAGGVYVGIPATPEREQMQQVAATAKLPEMRKTLRALQRQVDALMEAKQPSV